MKTGTTTLGFVDEKMSKGYKWAATKGGVKSGIEIVFAAADAPKAYQHAVKSGARELQKPKKQSWGGVQGWVLDPWGTVVQLCTPGKAGRHEIAVSGRGRDLPSRLPAHRVGLGQDELLDDHFFRVECPGAAVAFRFRQARPPRAPILLFCAAAADDEEEPDGGHQGGLPYSASIFAPARLRKARPAAMSSRATPRKM